jgi:hypothetical protein
MLWRVANRRHGNLASLKADASSAGVNILVPILEATG